MQNHELETMEVEPALSDKEMDDLDNFLMSDATSNEVMLLDCLDGYLTAVASGPVKLNQSEWLPRVWGPTAEDAPTFDSKAEEEQIIGLMARHLNAIVWNLQQEDEPFEPVFDLNVYLDDEREYVDGEMWAHGYMTAISLHLDRWNALFESKHGVEMLRPIYLLGAEDVSEEEEKLVETPAQREDLSRTIPASVGWIFKFWAPQRRAEEIRTSGRSSSEDTPKISRNAPCICGSGRKFKKCCGASAE
ncbi:MAG: YecA family protein [Sideroxydans sp.]|nr:YecA family protein [Sideroxydans sp.]